jgi:hypothetical protein
MGHLGARGGIAILQEIVYVPLFIIAIFIVIKLGFNKRLGWLYLVIFSLVRILGAAFEISFTQMPQVWSATAAGVCDSIGLAPLLLITMALLKRV